MSHTNAAPLRTTYWVFQIGSKLARSACGTKRNTRAAARCEIAGVASPPVAVRTPAPATDFRNALRFMMYHPLACHDRRQATAGISARHGSPRLTGNRRGSHYKARL